MGLIGEWRWLELQLLGEAVAMACGGSSAISAIARAREEKGGAERRRGLSRGSALLSALARLPAIGGGGRCCSGEYRGRVTGLTAR